MKWCGFINKYSAMQVLFGHGVNTALSFKLR